MPCRSPPPLASQPYLSMAQQSNGIGVPPPTQPKKQSAGMPVQPSSGQPATNNAVPARNGYNERAMAEIKNSLSNYEKVNGLHRPIRPVSALSTGSSTNSAYSSDYVQCLALNGGLVLDEVSPEFFKSFVKIICWVCLLSTEGFWLYNTLYERFGWNLSAKTIFAEKMAVSLLTPYHYEIKQTMHLARNWLIEQKFTSKQLFVVLQGV